MDAAITCTAYLRHESLKVLFDAQSSPEDVQKQILDKELVFFDYAANMWLQHVYLIEYSAALMGSGLIDILFQLLEARDLNDPETLRPPASMVERFKAFGDKYALQKSLAQSYWVQGKLQYGGSMDDGEMIISA